VVIGQQRGESARQQCMSRRAAPACRLLTVALLLVLAALEYRRRSD
jgi:hypothetical protein